MRANWICSHPVAGTQEANCSVLLVLLPLNCPSRQGGGGVSTRLEAMTQERKEGGSSWAERQTPPPPPPRGRQKENCTEAVMEWWRGWCWQERVKQFKKGGGGGDAKWLEGQIQFARVFVPNEKTKTERPHPRGHLTYYSVHGPVSHRGRLRPEAAAALHNVTLFPKIAKQTEESECLMGKNRREACDKTDQPRARWTDGVKFKGWHTHELSRVEGREGGGVSKDFSGIISWGCQHTINLIQLELLVMTFITIDWSIYLFLLTSD